MSTIYANTPNQRLAEECDKTADGQLSFASWQEHHDVFPWLLPLKARQQNPLETAKIISNGLDDLPELAETFRRKEWGLEDKGDSVTQKIFRLFKITVFDDTPRPIRYRNPNYRYYKERTQPIMGIENRHEHYQKWKFIPTVNTVWFGRHWGIDSKSAGKWINRNYMDVKEQMRYNKVRLARTLRTYQVWTGESLSNVIEPLPMPYSTGQDMVRRYAKNTEWKPPERPCPKHWFVANNR